VPHFLVVIFASYLNPEVIKTTINTCNYKNYRFFQSKYFKFRLSYNIIELMDDRMLIYILTIFMVVIPLILVAVLIVLRGRQSLRIPLYKELQDKNLLVKIQVEGKIFHLPVIDISTGGVALLLKGEPTKNFFALQD
jgi:hypothetical protein